MTMKPYVVRMLKHLLLKSLPAALWQVATKRKQELGNKLFKFEEHLQWLVELDRVLTPPYNQLAVYNEYIGRELLPSGLVMRDESTEYNYAIVIDLPIFADVGGNTRIVLKQLQEYTISTTLLHNIPRKMLFAINLSDLPSDKEGNVLGMQEVSLSNFLKAIASDKVNAITIRLKLFSFWLLLVNRLYNSLQLQIDLDYDIRVKSYETFRRSLIVTIKKLALENSSLKISIANLALVLWLILLVHQLYHDIGLVTSNPLNLQPINMYNYLAQITIQQLEVL